MSIRRESESRYVRETLNTRSRSGWRAGNRPLLCAKSRCAAFQHPSSGVNNFLLRCIAPRSDVPAMAGPVGMEELAPGLIYPLVGVGSEKVSLRLKQVGG